MNPVLETRRLTKYYGKYRGIENVSLRIYPGEIFGFLGPNGAGKTTTIRLALDLIRPTSGEYIILGAEGPENHIHIRDRIGYLPGEVGYYLNMTGKQFLDYLGGYQKAGGAPLRGKLLERFGLSGEAMDKNIKYFSKGMKQKLGLIQAMQHDPELLILDEPSEGLDPMMQLALYEALRDFRNRGKTVFFSSHILSEVERICDRVAIIREGQIQAEEKIETLKKKAVRRVTAQASPESLVRIGGIEGITVERRTDGEITFLFKGDINQLLKSLSTIHIDNLVFPEPELEDIFMAYY